MPAPHVRQRRQFRHQRLVKLGYVDYRDYLRSPHWLRLREQFRESDHSQECICGETEDLELHHKTYDRIGEELLEDLVWLCSRCHAMTHVLERRGEMDLALTGFTSEERAERFQVHQGPIKAKAASEFETRDRREEVMRRHARSLAGRTRLAVLGALRRDINIRQELDAIEIPLREIERKCGLRVSSPPPDSAP